MNARLTIRRVNNEPKCASCGWWQGNDQPAGKCGRHEIVVLDLSVCTDWRDGETVQEVLRPESGDR